LLTSCIYAAFNKYIFYFTVFIAVLYCADIVIKRYVCPQKIITSICAVFVIVLYVCIAFSNFYPQFLIPQKEIQVAYPFQGWNFYNAQSIAFKNFRLEIPISPSEKLKNFPYPYNKRRLYEELDYKKHDFVLDMSYYKEKYYMYFGITPILVLYLPFLIITETFILDSAAVLLFSIFAFLAALVLLDGLLKGFRENKDTVFNILKILCLGICCVCPLLIIMPRVYETAVVCAIFFGILSYMFLLFYLKNKSRKVFLFFAGICAALAVGARPFYAFIILAQILVFTDLGIFKTQERTRKRPSLILKKFIDSYALYFIPVLVYGFLLAIYNILRFDNPFEFGFKYQLSVYDTENVNFLPALFTHVKDFFFIKPIFLKEFPYIISNSATISGVFKESYIGLFYLVPLSALLVLGGSYFKNKNILTEDKKIIASLLVCCLIIITVQSRLPILMYRFAADIAFYLIICALVFSVSMLESLRGVKLYIMRFFVILIIFTSIVFSCAVLVSYNCQYGLGGL
jgi:hypothetical protein